MGVFIGPEGGFTEEEINLALAQDITPITLGPRILRSETASLVVLANIMYEMGEMK
jgi:16S rRNA (uracil1498-N3)-methyltransferase